MKETAARIASLIKTDGLCLTPFDEATSTNTLCKEAAERGAPEGTVILAASQTGGRGTRGRTFFSPHGSGLYMSLLLRPSLTAQQTLCLTTTAAVAVCEAIEAVSDRRPQIKWVNDVYCGGKKVCGILTEATLDPQTGRPRYVVLGIGINVEEPEDGFPEELRNIAAAVFPKGEGDRAALAAAILDAFFVRYATLGAEEHSDAYRQRSMLDGQTVKVTTPQGVRAATVLGIDGACRLRVRFANGEEQALLSGDVTLHLRDG